MKQMAKATRKPTQSEDSKAVAEPYQPTELEREATEQYVAAQKTRLPAPKLKATKVKGKWAFDRDHPDNNTFAVMMSAAFGTANCETASLLASQSIRAAMPDPDAEPNMSAINGAIALVHGIRPTDEVEGMLATQMVATHSAAMECLKRAQLYEQTFEGRKQNLNFATKLLRTYTAQMEALNRHRGKGQQKMTVEHVHVHDGGQAIVGNVSKGGGGELEK